MTHDPLPHDELGKDDPSYHFEWEQFGNLTEDGLLLVDRDQIIRMANPSASKLLGEELVNRPLSAWLQDINLDDIFDNITANHRPHEFIYRHAKPITRQFRVKMMAFGPIFVGVLVMDMTLQRNLDKVRRDFVANVSHELRSPLTSLIGFIETLQSTSDIDEETRSHFLGIMDEESRRMTRLIDDLISLSRVEVEEHIVPDEQVDIDSVIANVSGILADRAQKQNMVISYENHLEGQPALIQGETDEIVEVFHNLIENAIKYGFPDSLIHIQLSYAPHSQTHIQCAVTNDGEGIEARHIPRLTERFYRVDKARSREKGGTGLGLAIVKHIINRHRGELHITSELKKQTCFTITLPLQGNH